MWITFHLHLVKWLIRHGRYTKVLSSRKGVDPPWLVLYIHWRWLMIVPLRVVVYQLPCTAILAIKPVNAKISLPLPPALLPLACTLENNMFPSGVSAGSKLELTL